jgi:hypothetical protein
MITTQTEQATAPAISSGAELDRVKEIVTRLPGALTAGSRAYVSGILALGRALGGQGREIAAEAGRHAGVTLNARSLREVAELQAAWVQHRAETSTAHAKEFADLAHAKTIDVIAPFVALLRQDKPA